MANIPEGFIEAPHQEPYWLYTFFVLPPLAAYHHYSSIHENFAAISYLVMAFCFYKAINEPHLIHEDNLKSYEEWMEKTKNSHRFSAFVFWGLLIGFAIYAR